MVNDRIVADFLCSIFLSNLFFWVLILSKTLASLSWLDFLKTSKVELRFCSKLSFSASKRLKSSTNLCLSLFKSARDLFCSYWLSFSFEIFKLKLLLKGVFSSIFLCKRHFLHHCFLQVQRPSPLQIPCQFELDASDQKWGLQG